MNLHDASTYVAFFVVRFSRNLHKAGDFLRSTLFFIQPIFQLCLLQSMNTESITVFISNRTESRIQLLWILFVVHAVKRSYIADCERAKDAALVRQVLQEPRVKTIPTLYTDSEGAFNLSKTAKFDPPELTHRSSLPLPPPGTSIRQPSDEDYSWEGQSGRPFDETLTNGYGEYMGGILGGYGQTSGWGGTAVLGTTEGQLWEAGIVTWTLE